MVRPMSTAEKIAEPLVQLANGGPVLLEFRGHLEESQQPFGKCLPHGFRPRAKSLLPL
jgi:hypothetical protein